MKLNVNVSQNYSVASKNVAKKAKEVDVKPQAKASASKDKTAPASAKLTASASDIQAANAKASMNLYAGGPGKMGNLPDVGRYTPAGSGSGSKSSSGGSSSGNLEDVGRYKPHNYDDDLSGNRGGGAGTDASKTSSDNTLSTGGNGAKSTQILDGSFWSSVKTYKKT